MTECTCEHYVVDYSDPEQYHSENVDREGDPKCPVHGCIWAEPTCPDCGHTVPIVHSRGREELHWARHAVTGSLTSSDGPECENSGSEWEDEGTTSWTPGNQGW